MSESWFHTAGLAIDFAGVAFLGVDLIRLQAQLKRQAANNLATLVELSSDYGGIEAWAAEIRKTATWFPELTFSDYRGEDEAAFNTRNAVERLAEVADCANGLVGHLATVTTYLGSAARESQRGAKATLRYSVVGMVLIAAGLALQLVGAWPAGFH